MPREAHEGRTAVAVANAPVSFGVFELTAAAGAPLPSAERVIDAVATPRYDGIDLGPVGFLGVGAKLRDRLERQGLGLAGGWVELRFLDPDALEDDLARLRSTMETFLAGWIDPRPCPRPTLADAGSPRRRASPGHASHSPELGLSPEEWRSLCRGIERAVGICRDAGLEPAFHHHAGTHVESVEEVERVLEHTDVGLCLDTGHLVIGGGDPVEALQTWRDRINHVHIKDVDRSMLADMVARRAPMGEIWEAGVFREFGTGDVDIAAFARSLLDGAYRGWIVVEQDRVLEQQDSFEAVAQEQARNLQYLRDLGL